MKGRKIEEMGVSSRGLYMRNIAGIIPNGGDICSNMDIPKLYAIGFGDKNYILIEKTF